MTSCATIWVPLLEKEGQKTQIWMIDHNFNLWGRALASLEEWDLKKYCKAIAWHGYVGDPAKADRGARRASGHRCLLTEGGPGFDDPNLCQGLDSVGAFVHWFPAQLVSRA